MCHELLMSLMTSCLIRHEMPGAPNPVSRRVISPDHSAPATLFRHPESLQAKRGAIYPVSGDRRVPGLTHPTEAQGIGPIPPDLL